MIRHANASSVGVLCQFLPKENQMILEVRDNARGITPGPSGRRTGKRLESMRQRARCRRKHSCREHDWQRHPHQIDAAAATAKWLEVPSFDDADAVVKFHINGNTTGCPKSCGKLAWRSGFANAQQV